MNKQTVGMLIAGVALIGVVGWFWLGSGYGKVSPKTYEFATAMYSASLTKNERHLEKIEQLLAQTEDDALANHERTWIQNWIRMARSGDWDTVANQSKRMMEDQVDY